MTDPFKRGSAPGRAREASDRPGSFEEGHEKRGGRKRGTPNRFSGDYKKAIVEAAYRVGEDGNGKNGVVGYFSWVAERHPRTFATVLLCNILSMELADPDTSEEPRVTAEESNRHIRDYIGLGRRKRTNRQTVQVEFASPWAWTGGPYQLAV